MRRTFWQGITSRAECAKLSASSSFERSSFSFMDFANIPRLCLYVYYVIHMYTHTRWWYVHVCMYMHTCSFRVFQRNGDSNRIRWHRIVRFDCIQFSELRRKKSKGCELEMMAYARWNVVFQFRSLIDGSLFEPFDYALSIGGMLIFAKIALSGKRLHFVKQFVQLATKPRVHVPNSIAPRAFTLTIQVSMYQTRISHSLIFNRKKNMENFIEFSGIFFCIWKN